MSLQRKLLIGNGTNQDIDLNPPDNEIWYISKKNKVEEPYSVTDGFVDTNIDASATCNMLSNTYSNGLGKMVFDAPITQIPSLFLSGSTIEQIGLPNQITRILNGAFVFSTSLWMINMPPELVYLDHSVFAYCYQLQNIKFPYNLTKINRTTFSNCSSLTSVEISPNINIVDHNAFSYCKNLQMIKIGKNVSSISYEAFYRCSLLSTIIIQANEPPTLGHKNELMNLYPTFYGCATPLNVYVPDGFESVYAQNQDWGAYYSNMVFHPLSEYQNA